MRNTKTIKWLLILTCLVAALFAFTLAANAAIVDSGTCGAEDDGRDLTWTLDDNGTLTISGIGSMEDYSYGDHFSYSTAPWSGSEEKAQRIKSVVIEKGVTSISSYAFMNCKNLSRVEIPDSVKCIKTRAFYSCSELKEITIPDTITSIYENAFQFTGWYKSQPFDQVMYIGRFVYGYKRIKTDITDLVIEDGTKGIADSAFYKCEDLKTVVIPDSVIAIGANAFGYCKSLKNVTVSENLEYIGNNAFYNTPWYEKKADGMVYIGKVAYCYKGVMPKDTHIKIKNGTKGIAADAFSAYSTATESMKNLVEITIPESLTNIGWFAFAGCDNLKKVNISSIESWCRISFEDHSNPLEYAEEFYLNGNKIYNLIIPYGVTSIGENAFYDFYLSSAMIPDSVISIGDNAFTKCKNIYYTGAEKQWSKVKKKNISPSCYNCVLENNLLYDTKKSTLLVADVSIVDPIIPDSVTSIASNAFLGCTKLKNITIPENVSSIGESAFFQCTSLSSVTIPNSITEIKNSTFQNCTGLVSIVIPDSVLEIGNNVFSGCNGLKEVFIGDGIKTLPRNLLASCINLETLHVPFIGASADTTTENGNAKLGYLFGTTSDEFENEQFIKQYAWNQSYSPYEKLYYCIPKTLKKVVIGNQETTIKELAFSHCTCLTSVIIGDNVTSIGESAFSGCTSLKSVTIPDSVDSIGSAAFAGCLELKEITIPNKLQRINEKTFSGCSGLESIMIPDSVTYIAYSAFSGCTGITSVSMENAMTEISNSAFSDTPWYKDHPDGIIYAGRIVFTYKGIMPENTKINLKKDTIGIINYAFSNQVGMISITIPKGVTKIGKSAFSSCTGLTKIIIPDSVDEMGASVFSGCKRLGTVKISNGLSEIPENAFSDCTNLSEIVIPKGIRRICKYAFKNCNYYLTEITIPKSVTDILYGAFENDTILYTTKYSGSEEEWRQILIEDKNDALFRSIVYNSKIVGEPELAPGDVDGDGKLTSADARLALRASVGLEPDITTGSDAYLAADADGDGKVSSADARLILRASVGLEDPKTFGKKA